MAEDVYGITERHAETINRAVAETKRLGQSAMSVQQIAPMWRRNWQIVELSSGTANGDGTYSGWWNLSASGTMEHQATIRIKAYQALATGKYYLGYFSHFDETNHVGVFIVLDAPAATTGITGDKTVVTDVTWDTATCTMTKTTHAWTFTNGLLTAVS